MYTDFEYAGKRLSDFGYMTCSFNGGTSVEDIEIGCDISFNTIKNNHSSIHYKTSTSYENVYTTTIEITKIPCGKEQEDLYHMNEEISVLTTWLNRREYHKFKPLSSTTTSSNVHYYGSFNVKEKNINGRTIGFVLSFIGNAPYGFGEQIVNEFILDDNENTFVIYGDSDEYTTLYPNASIICRKSGDLKIKNTLTGNVFEILNCIENETIYVNGEHKFIDSDNENHKNTTLFNDFNYEFLDIYITDNGSNENMYEVSLPCEIIIKYFPIRKVGV